MTSRAFLENKIHASSRNSSTGISSINVLLLVALLVSPSSALVLVVVVALLLGILVEVIVVLAVLSVSGPRFKNMTWVKLQ